MAVDAETQKLLDEVAEEEASAAAGQPVLDIEDGTQTDTGFDHEHHDDDGDDDQGDGLDDDDTDNPDGKDDQPADVDTGKTDGDDQQGDDDLPEDEDGMTLAQSVAENRVDEFKAKEQEVDGKLDELEKQYEAGDVTTAEYNKQMRVLNRELTDVVSDRKAEEIRVTNAHESVNREWSRAQKAFFKENPGYEDPKSPLYRALDAEVRAITRDPEKQHLTFSQVLHKAKSELAKAFGTAPAKKAVSDHDDKNKTQGKPRKPAVQLPPSLDDLPSGAESQQSEFAHLEKLSGTAHRDAFAKLTKEQQDRYLAGS